MRYCGALRWMRARDAAAGLASSSDPAVRAVGEDAQTALARVQKAGQLEIPIRLQVTTGKNNRSLPLDVPGILRESAPGRVTFYPADESLRPFDVDSAQAAHLPRDVPVNARSSKKSLTFDEGGVTQKASLYVVQKAAPGVGAQQFTAVVDLVGGAPHARALGVSPPVLFPIQGAVPAEGTVVSVQLTSEKAVVSGEIAAPGTPKARVWEVADAQRLDAIFSPRALEETAAIQQAPGFDDAALLDLTQKPFFAIDNPGSKDIDQAMYLEKTPDGGFVLSYALADAAYYIKPGLALFDEAMERGYSYYLPGMSVPMLPPALSDGVISLNAHETHRAMILKVRLDKNGMVQGEPEVQRARIHSQAQLTYAGVSAELKGQGRIAADERGHAVPQAVREQLLIFQELGGKRQEQARQRGVVEPARFDTEIRVRGNAFSLEDTKADYASALNAEMSILANVAGAQATAISTVIPGLEVPGIYKTHAQPPPSAFRALRRQLDVTVEQNGMPAVWKWQKEETLSAYVERLKTLPTDARSARFSIVLQGLTVRINSPAQFEGQPAIHSGLQLSHYGRFTAPMREQVGVVSHAVLFAKTALENAVRGGHLDIATAQKVWPHLLLATLVDPNTAPDPARRAALATFAALVGAAPSELAARSAAVAAAANNGLTDLSEAEKRSVDGVMKRAKDTGNLSKQRQGQVEGAARKLLFDDLFQKDLGGNPEAGYKAPVREGTIAQVAPGKLYVLLDEPDVELRLNLEDLQAGEAGANYVLDQDAAELVKTGGEPTSSRLLVGARIKVKASHHDGDRLRFSVVR